LWARDKHSPTDEDNAHTPNAFTVQTNLLFSTILFFPCVRKTARLPQDKHTLTEENNNAHTRTAIPVHTTPLPLPILVHLPLMNIKAKSPTPSPSISHTNISNNNN